MFSLVGTLMVRHCWNRSSRESTGPPSHEGQAGGGKCCGEGVQCQPTRPRELVLPASSRAPAGRAVASRAWHGAFPLPSARRHLLGGNVRVAVTVSFKMPLCLPPCWDPVFPQVPPSSDQSPGVGMELVPGRCMWTQHPCGPGCILHMGLCSLEMTQHHNALTTALYFHHCFMPPSRLCPGLHG